MNTFALFARQLTMLIIKRPLFKRYLFQRINLQYIQHASTTTSTIQTVLIAPHDPLDHFALTFAGQFSVHSLLLLSIRVRCCVPGRHGRGLGSHARFPPAWPERWRQHAGLAPCAPDGPAAAAAAASVWTPSPQWGPLSVAALGWGWRRLQQLLQHHWCCFRHPRL